MEECFKCNASEERTQLFDVINEEGIVKICRSCSFSEDIPIVRKPNDFSLKESQRPQSVYERLSRAAGIDIEDKENFAKTAKFSKKNFEGAKSCLLGGRKFHETINSKFSKQMSNSNLQKKEETDLRGIVDRNFEEKILEKPQNSFKKTSDLIDNFHWVIMRSRRSKKITQGQLAKDISESELAVKMAEKGILPENYYGLIKKIESCLNVRIIKKEEKQDVELIKKNPEKIDFNSSNFEGLTISDLQEMKKKKEGEIFGDGKIK